MAASEPASSLHSWESNSAGETLSLEGGMSGMNLMTSLSDASGLKGTGSTVSTSPPDELGAVGQLPAGSDYSARGSAPPSPGSERQAASLKSQARPPGLSGPMPSPIGKAAASKNTSATSPSLTLTPNSTDGNSDWNSLGRQHSPFSSSDAPPMPFLHAEHRRGADGSFGSADFSDEGNDGLMGLGALRERAYSSPGPALSNSPPVARGHFSAHPPPPQQQPFDQQLPRGRDRPPRSQPFDGYASYQGDRSLGGISLPLSSAASSRSDPNLSMDSTDFRSFLGAIARPELRQSATEFDPSRFRASSAEFQNPYGNFQPPPVGGDPVSHKFGSLPTLGTHLQQQRSAAATDQYGNQQKPRHVRSVSQPGPTGFPSAPVQMPHGIDPRFYGGPSQSNRHSFTGSSHARSTSVGQPGLPSSYDASRYNQKASHPMPVVAGFQHSGLHQSLQRRDGLDYHVGSASQSHASDDMRSFSGVITPGQSPLHGHYPTHIRHPSDSGSAMLSSSPVSMGSGIMHGSTHSGHTYHRSSNDDDLALVGEHIEVPADHDEYSMHGHYRVHSGGHPLLGAPSHSHTVSMDQLPPQFIETAHHLPTAGAALSMPKLVYSVKFKRTQRNFVLGPRINRDLKIGTYVKVEADRGEDLGIVVGKTSSEKLAFSARSSFTAGMAPSSSISGAAAADLKRIIRFATHDEVSLLSMKREEEEELLKICRSKVRQRGLPMHVVDAEYQFDRHKLTFFFEAEGRVDFRELVRDLFSIYKTRIWMQQLDKNTSTSAQAITSPQTSNLQMDYGTPIIAPVSEFADSVVMSNLSGGDARSH